ncbi:MAG: hypothetical protein R3B48_15525 [Kofleriaceae bacterium]
MLDRCHVGGPLSASIFIDTDGRVHLLELRREAQPGGSARPLEERVHDCVERDLSRWTVSNRARAALGPWPPSWIRLALVPEKSPRAQRPRPPASRSTRRGR